MIELFLYFAIFIFGLIIGSFLNCVIYRLEIEDSPFKGKSYCPKCKYILKWLDLIPILSFFTLKGKCRYCSQKISLQYPLVEIATGFLFVLIFNFFIPNFAIIFYYWIIASLLIVIFVYDFKHYIIPDKIIYSLIGLTFLYQLFAAQQGWASLAPLGRGILDLGLAILPSLFFLAIILFSRGQWMGLGDFKLAIFMGLFLGWPNILVALFLSFFIGAIIGMGLIFLNKKTLKSEVPFAPFLIIGTFIVLFWGQNIIDWYWHFSLFLLK